MASLRIIVDGVEQKFPLDAAAVTLGRGLESDIRLKDIKASRRHCQVVKTPKGYQCVDLSSGNGTYVNGVQIKQQMLGPGDRITIGSTTISFEDATPAPKAAPARPPSVSPRSPTEKLPVATPPRPVPSTGLGTGPAAAPAPAASATRHGTGRVASEKIPVAPSRKSTARGVEAVKSASQGALKPVSQPVAKASSRVGKALDAAAGAGRPVRTGGTRPVRPPAEAGRKKSPLLLIAAAAGVLLLGGGAFFFFSSHDNGDQVREKVDLLVKKAEKAEKADKLDEAIQDYKRALELCQGDRYKVRASELGKLLAGLEAPRSAGSVAAPKNDPKENTEKGPDFQAKRSEIAEKHKIAGDPSAADWTGALKDWSDFLRGKVPDETKAKVTTEMGSVHTKAKEDADRLRKKAEALAQENKMAEAVDFLRQQLPRFQHPALKDVADDLQSALRKYDK